MNNFFNLVKKHVVIPRGRFGAWSLFRLEDEDGSPVEPHTFKTAVPSWRVGDVIPLPHRSLRVVEVRDDDADQAPTLVVEELAERSAWLTRSVDRGGGVRQRHWD